MKPPILIVEDSLNDIELALYAFNKCGVKRNIVVVRDGEEALDYLFLKKEFAERDASNPALILLDLKLPKIDGMEVLKTVRFTPRLSSIPVVIATASFLEADIQRTSGLGIDRYVVKQIETSRFVEAICEISSLYHLN